jgi:hypothetical protein
MNPSLSPISTISTLYSTSFDHDNQEHNPVIKCKNYIVSQTVNANIKQEYKYALKFVDQNGSFKEYITTCLIDENNIIYIEFLPLIQFFSKNNNLQRLIYQFESPEQKCSMHKKMYLTTKGLDRLMDYIMYLKKRKNGIFKNDNTDLFMLQLNNLKLYLDVKKLQ